MKKDRIVYLAQAALTVRETIWFKKMKRNQPVKPPQNRLRKTVGWKGTFANWCLVGERPRLCN
jgi:hypothetical protein